MRPAERKLLHAKVMRVWRSVTASHYVERKALDLKPISDQELLDAHSLLAPQTMVTLMRVNLLIRVITKGSDALRRALFVARNAEWSWLRAVELDFVKLAKLSREFAPFQTFTSWISDIRGRPKFWRNLLKKVAALPEANQIELIQPKPRKILVVQVPGVVISCSVCHAVQASQSAKAIHEFRQHGVRKPARRFILEDNMCRHCLKQFPSRHLCNRHLTEYTKTCLAALQCCVTPISVEESERLDVHDIEVKKRHLTISKNGRGARSVAVQYFGPNTLDFRPYYDQVAAGAALEQLRLAGMMSARSGWVSC